MATPPAGQLAAILRLLWPCFHSEPARCDLLFGRLLAKGLSETEGLRGRRPEAGHSAAVAGGWVARAEAVSRPALGPMRAGRIIDVASLIG
jgi:hypothetical protein